ncbi:MAG: glycosyltransferase family 2 protein [Clostridiales bacterium]|nr:glycosyltransferase family 2 protein [Clostridiales bacterium]
MGNISFVILNYNTYEEAIVCAESILNTQTYPDIQIVIVDNGSKNDSTKRLEEYQEGKERVHLVVSKENLGFAKGNNLGIRYAREHFSPDFIVAANSDIIFEQPDYCEKLIKVYEENRYDILGGDVIDVSRTQHFNPVARERRYTLNYMRKQVLVSRAKAWMFRLIKLLHLKKAVTGHYGIATDENGTDVKDGSKNLTTREVEGKSVSADCRIEETLTGVLLHGCCLVFSKDFFREFDGFWEGTFLYAEEEILYYLAMKKGMTLLYSPEVWCMHKEAATTSSMYRDFCDGKIFYFSNITKSYRLFLSLMKEEENG